MSGTPFKSWFLCALFVVSIFSTGCAAEKTVVGFLTEGDLTAEQKHAFAWIEKHERFAARKLPLRDVAAGTADLEKYPVLWLHRDTQIARASRVNDPRVRAQLRSYVEGGGGLLLSLLAMPVVELLGEGGIDHAPDVCAINPDYNTPVTGVLVVKDHPIFKGLPRPVINIQSAGQRYLPFARYHHIEPEDGTVLGCGSMNNSHIRFERIVVHWDVGKGKVIAFGQYNFWFSTLRNEHRANLSRLTGNILTFLAAKGKIVMAPAKTPDDGTTLHEGRVQYAGGGRSPGGWRLANDWFQIGIHGKTGAVTELRCAKDTLDTNFVIYSTPRRDGRNVGDVVCRYRAAGDKGDWRTAWTSRSNGTRTIEVDDPKKPTRVTVAYRKPSRAKQGIRDFELVEEYRLDKDTLVWTVSLKNNGKQALEFGDVGFPLPFNEQWSTDQVANYEQRVYRHTLLAEDGGYLYMQRPGGRGHVLAMLPDADSDFEFFRRALTPPHGPRGSGWIGLVTFYVHGREALKDALKARRQGGNDHDWVPGKVDKEWFVPVSTMTLEPGASKAYTFRFRWAKNLDRLGDVLVDTGKLDVAVIPGMVVPAGIPVKVGLRAAGGVKELTAEFGKETRIVERGTKKAPWQIYEVRFSKYGPNNLTVEYGDGKRMPLQFFVTLPTEETIKRHAAFKAKRQLYRDPRDGYDGAFLLWHQWKKRVSHPKTTPGLPAFFYGTDDLGYGQALFLARKNEIFPDPKEIAALDHHLDKWIWDDSDGKELQDHETYGIWWAWPKVNATGRSYNYPHLMNTYLSMYRIQKWYGLSKYLSAKDYLDRAYRTARALYTLPMWSKGHMEWGLMCESTWPELIAALRAEGMVREAKEIEGYWAKKAEHMNARRKRYPFGSEISIDSTAFEACHALARWGDHREFIEIIRKANEANRGHQPAWYVYASDNRWIGDSHYQLSYMTHLAGWALLDYVLEYAKEPERSKLLRIAYASVTASWANIRKTNDINDGSANWVFHVENGRRGWAPTDGEIPIGFFGGLLAASSIVAEDPLFGLVGYGCDVEKKGGAWRIAPRDGVRQHVVHLPAGVRLRLDRDHFRTVVLAESLDSVDLVLQNGFPTPHQTSVAIKGLRPGTYEVKGVSATDPVTVKANKTSQITLTIGKAAEYRIKIRRQ